jgi:hypothetical protein
VFARGQKKKTRSEMMKPTKRSEAETRHRTPDLEVRYGEIGIAALAAALRYQGEVKSAPESAAPRDDRWLPEMAA